MIVANDAEMEGIKKVSTAVAHTLRSMQEYARPGLSTKELDCFGGNILQEMGAKSAPFAAYGFPGWTCISLNNEFCHGIPSSKKILQEGDLINIDVSAESDGYWADNGGSFVLGEDINGYLPLVEASRAILKKAIETIQPQMRVSDIGRLIEAEAAKKGFKVIRNLTGHGVGRRLHEAPKEIPNYYDPYNFAKFTKNSVVAIETFITTKSSYAKTLPDGWTMVGNKGGFMAQHEHTVLVADKSPQILTAANGIF